MSAYGSKRVTIRSSLVCPFYNHLKIKIKIADLSQALQTSESRCIRVHRHLIYP